MRGFGNEFESEALPGVCSKKMPSHLLPSPKKQILSRGAVRELGGRRGFPGVSSTSSWGEEEEYSDACERARFSRDFVCVRVTRSCVHGVVC
jgi:hypothetical protein